MAMKQFVEDELADVTKPVVSDAVQKARAAAAAAAQALADAEAASAPAPTTQPAPAKPAPQRVVDELEDEPKMAKPTSNANPHARPAADEDLDVDFGDEELAKRPNMLNRCRPDKGKFVRFALLDVIKPKSAKNHFVEVGQTKLTARCLTPNGAAESAYCCNKLGKDGELHVAALVVRYLNADDNTGGYAKGVATEWEVQYVDLTRANYRAVSHLIDDLVEDNPNVTVYDIDIVMSHDESRAFGYKFARASMKAPRWKQNPELIPLVKEAAEKFTKEDGKILKARLGKKLSLAEWKQLLTGSIAGAKEATLEDIEGLE